MKRVSKEESEGRGATGCCCPIRWTFLKYVPYQSHQERRGECGRRAKNTALPPSRPTDRPDSRSIRPTMTLHRREREQSQKNAFCSLIAEERNAHHPPFLFAREMFSISFRIIVHSVSLCRVLCGEEGEARRRGRAIKWFSRPSTSGWRCDKISNSPPSPSACPELQYHVK